MALKQANELSKLITAIGRIGKKTDAMIQTAATHAIGYSIEHGDIRFANQLLSNLSEGTRRAAFVAFMEHYGCVAYMSTEKQFKFFKRDNLTFNADEIESGKQWHAFKTENIVSMYDVAKMVDSLVRKIEKGIEKGMKIENAALLDDIKIVSAQFHGANIGTPADELEVDLPDEELAAFLK